jgi:hypothetical protein
LQIQTPNEIKPKEDKAKGVCHRQVFVRQTKEEHLIYKCLLDRQRGAFERQVLVKLTKDYSLTDKHLLN